MRTGSSQYLTTHKWVSSWLPFTVDYGLSWFILILSKGMPSWNSHYRLWGIVWIILMNLFSWQCQILCWLSLAFIIDWRAVPCYMLWMGAWKLGEATSQQVILQSHLNFPHLLKLLTSRNFLVKIDKQSNFWWRPLVLMQCPLFQ